MSTEQIAQIVDAKGLSCPMPIVKTAQAAKGLASGQLLEVLATDPGSTAGVAVVSATAVIGVVSYFLRRTKR